MRANLLKREVGITRVEYPCPDSGKKAINTTYDGMVFSCAALGGCRVYVQTNNFERSEGSCY